MNVQFQIFTAFWLFSIFAMRLAAEEMFSVRPPAKLVLIRGGKR